MGFSGHSFVEYIYIKRRLSTKKDLAPQLINGLRKLCPFGIEVAYILLGQTYIAFYKGLTMKNNLFTSSLASTSALALILGLSAPIAHSIPFIIEGVLTGDIRDDNPDNLFVNVTVTGDTTSNQAFWTIDINSPDHPDVKLDEFYFNMFGLATDYTFSDFDPTGWTVNSPATVQGGGGATFMFESLDPAGPPDALDVTNSQNLTFTMTYSGGNFTPLLFTDAPEALSNEAGFGQLGAHLQSLTIAGNCGTSTDCSDSGFAFGSYTVPPQEVPEPATLALLGLGLLGIGVSRRRKK